MTKQSSKTTVRSAVKAALGTSVAVPLLFAAVPAMAQSDAMIELRNQIEQLEARLDMMASQEDMNDGTVQLGETEINFSGYVKLDTFYAAILIMSPRRETAGQIPANALQQHRA